MPNSVKLLSIGTAVPSHIIDQKEAREAATAVFSPRYAEFSRLSKVFESSGIMRRFGVRPIDAVTFAAAAGVLVMAALAASYVPARRAAAVDPVQTLTGQ